MASAGVDQTTGRLALEDVVQACLVAGDTGVDFVGPLLRCLFDKFSISQERARHGDHIGMARCQYLLSLLRSIDAVGSDERDAHLAHQTLGDPTEAAPRHHGGDRRHSCLVPADARINDGGTGLLDALSQELHFLPGAAAFHQIQHRQAVNNDKISPDRLAGAAHDFEREADAVLVRPAPFISPLVGLGYDKLVDEVAFRPHDLHAVVAGLLGQHGCAHKVVDRALHSPASQSPGFERRDGRLER